jgi:hypothetical protein
MPATYEPIATYTIPSAQSSYTFSSISQAYTDIVLVSNFKGVVTGDNFEMRFNSDSGSNYSRTYLYGNGSVAFSGRSSNYTGLLIGTSDNVQPITIIANIMNYTNTTTFKTVLSRTNDTAGLYPAVGAIVSMWRATPAAINSITLFASSGNIASGSTFTLYGIKAA